MPRVPSLLRPNAIPALALILAAGVAWPASLAAADDRPAEKTTATADADTTAKSDDTKPDATKTEAEKIQEQTQLIKARIELLEAQQSERMSQLELEKLRIAAESALRDAKNQQDLAAMKAELERLTTEGSLRDAKLEDQFAQLNGRLKELQLNQQVADAERKAGTQDLTAEADRVRAENSLLEAKVAALNLQLQADQITAQTESIGLTSDLTLRKTKDEAKSVVLDDLSYASDPFQNGTLYVSDRRIGLNDVIMGGTADWVTRRIEYFNNQSTTLPIFIVIDSCPGGSVMEGYRIVDAIQHSDAPIYVVVKSYAASMAAVITTLADRSFAMPNAIILHHQMSTGAGGNLTEIKEQYENAIQWSRRLHEPVCQKLGITYDEFVKEMYEHNSAGDWEEFGDKAKELKWVNEVVTDIREVGVRSRPEDPAPRPWYWFLASADRYEPTAAQDNTNAVTVIQRDEKGLPYIQLPPLRPFDHYFLYDPNHFYRY